MSKTFLPAVAALVVAVTGAPKAYAVDATAVWNEFSKNEGAFVQRYKGKSMTISGQVWNVDSQAIPPSVVLRGANDGSNYGTRVYCILGSKDQAFKVSKGDLVTISGTFSSAGGIGIYFKPCSVQ